MAGLTSSTPNHRCLEDWAWRLWIIVPQPQPPFSWLRPTGTIFLKSWLPIRNSTFYSVFRLNPINFTWPKGLLYIFRIFAQISKDNFFYQIWVKLIICQNLYQFVYRFKFDFWNQDLVIQEIVFFCQVFGKNNNR